LTIHSLRIYFLENSTRSFRQERRRYRATFFVDAIQPAVDDVDIRPVIAAKSTTNIRIACAIDLSNEKHLAILSVLDEHTNVTYRHYKGEVTIWGMNRDSEKCVVCVVSKNKEVAGIGTILQEDIRDQPKMGRFGQTLLPRSCSVLTHCNAGALATAGYGTVHQPWP
jgi:methylthioribose-1-phosphate isomerase